MRPLLVEALDERVEARLLLQDVRRGRFGRFLASMELTQHAACGNPQFYVLDRAFRIRSLIGASSFSTSSHAAKMSKSWLNSALSMMPRRMLSDFLMSSTSCARSSDVI
jgi:hypothetical protein